MKLDDKVLAPLGPATISGYDEITGEYLVCYSRKAFTPEAWAKISPAGGPCVFRFYGEGELKCA